jgi:RND family efflux transporter MFP subunit
VSSAPPFGPPASGSSTGSFAFLEHALWKHFDEAKTPEEFASAWLALQCRFIPGVSAGVIVLGEPDTGPFAPLAFWPDESAFTENLAVAAERVISDRQSVVADADEQSSDGAAETIALPLFVEERLLGTVALSFDGSGINIRDTMRQLQWGAGWIEVLWRRELNRSSEQQRDRTALAFDMVATVLEQQHFVAAATALVTELAVTLECEQVSIGFTSKNHTELVALSHSSRFGEKMNLIRDLEQAMDEAVDQQAVVMYPEREIWDYRITRAHADLVQTHQIGSVLTIPLHKQGDIEGALSFEWDAKKEITDADIELCDAIASVIGPILSEKRANDRHIGLKIREAAQEQAEKFVGPEHPGRKLAAGVLAFFVLFFAVVDGDYRVTSSAVVEGLVQRTLVAPFEGYVATQNFKAGEVVAEGDVLATMDDRDIALERLRWSTKYRQHLAEYDKALASRERAEANIVQAQIDQARAQMALLDAQLERTAILAPFSGVIVSGDLSQSVGAAVERGQELFKIAPLDEYRVILEVDESDIENIQPGLQGELRIAAVPGESLTYIVERITPVSEQGEGKNFFRVEAMLTSESEYLRPGMGGVAKTDAGERLLISIWTDRLSDWLRLNLWKWLP